MSCATCNYQPIGAKPAGWRCGVCDPARATEHGVAPAMTLQVIVWINNNQDDFQVSAPTLSEAFALIPAEAASRGYALVNDGRPVDYQVSVIA